MMTNESFTGVPTHEFISYDILVADSAIREQLITELEAEFPELTVTGDQITIPLNGQGSVQVDVRMGQRPIFETDSLPEARQQEVDTWLLERGRLLSDLSFRQQNELLDYLL